MTVTLHGSKMELKGSFVKVGEEAKEFSMIQSADLSTWKLSEQKGTVLLNIYPSIDTPVCAASTKKFDTELAKIEGASIVCVSKDLPFAQQRFLKEHKLERIQAISAFGESTFGTEYGVEIADSAFAGLYTRAIVIIKEGKITYTELVTELADSPDFTAALAAL